MNNDKGNLAGAAEKSTAPFFFDQKGRAAACVAATS